MPSGGFHIVLHFLFYKRICFSSTVFPCGSDNSKTNLYKCNIVSKVNIYTILSVNLAQATQIWKLNKGLNDMLDFASLITS